MKKIVVLIFLAVASMIFPQKKESFNNDVFIIEGRIVDEDSLKSALPGVIVVAKNSANKTISGTTSDKHGIFKLKVTALDSLKISISLVGYQTKDMGLVWHGENNLNLGDIILKQKAVEMSAIIIKGEKLPIEYHADKQVVNVEKLPFQSSSIAEALKVIGAIDVDPVTNKISIRGKESVKILIDGKPLQMNNEYLSQVPAETIDKVEVITSPSAKDDPEGEAGIINLISKKNLFDSFSGYVSARQFTKNTTYVSSALNYKLGKINLFTNLSSGYSKDKYKDEDSFISKQSSDPYSNNSAGNSWGINKSLDLKLGIDYDPDESNSMSIAVGLLNQKYTANNSGNTIMRFENYGRILNYDYDVDANMHYKPYNITGFYRNKINDKGCEITSDLYFADIAYDRFYDYSKKYSYRREYPFLQKNNNKIKNKTIIFKAEYINPLEELGKIDAGYNYTHRYRTNDYESPSYSYIASGWIDSLNYSNLFKYTEDIHALYLLYSNTFKGISYRVGIRAEDALNNGDQVKGGLIFNNNYLSYYPSVNISYNIGQSQLYASYSRRVQRPDMDDVNPFVRSSSPYSISVGKADLDPVYTNSISTGIMPYFSLFYYGSKGKIMNVQTIIQDSVTFSTYINGPETEEYGAEMSLNLNGSKYSVIILPKWISAFNNRLSITRFIQKGSYSKEDLSENKTNISFNSYASIILWSKINASISFSYRPETKSQRFRRNRTTDLYFSLSRRFFENKLRITLSFNDLLNTNKSIYETFGSDFYSRFDYRPQNTRNMMLSINYTFNSYQSKEEREVDDGRDRSGSM
jgi:hypothetical protein